VDAPAPICYSNPRERNNGFPDQMTSMVPHVLGASRKCIGAVRNRRGAVAALFAVSATALLGMVALAAETGVWQLQRRETRTAADLSALAGAAAIERGADAVAIARDAVSRNGFVDGGDGGRTSVTVNRPPATGGYAGNANAVEVIVNQTQNLGMARIAFGTAPTVGSRAVALSVVDLQACLLALGGGLDLGGNSTTNARRCAMAANSSTSGINIFGSARVRATDLVTTGTCTGCDGPDVWTDDTRTARPAVVPNRANPITDPFAGLQSWTPTPPSTCTPVTYTNRVSNLTAGASGTTICSDVTIGTNETLNLGPGLYYLNNASLTVRGTLSGSGVTIVMTGNPGTVGTVRINAQSTTTLSGPSTSLIPGHSEGQGVVLYRDARATNNGSQNDVQLNGGAGMRITGSVYLPTSDVQVNGNSGNNYSTCMAIIGYYLSFSGNSDTTVDVSGCTGITAVPTQRVARLVE